MFNYTNSGFYNTTLAHEKQKHSKQNTASKRQPDNHL